MVKDRHVIMKCHIKCYLEKMSHQVKFITVGRNIHDSTTQGEYLLQV